MIICTEISLCGLCVTGLSPLGLAQVTDNKCYMTELQNYLMIVEYTIPVTYIDKLRLRDMKSFAQHLTATI